MSIEEQAPKSAQGDNDVMSVANKCMDSEGYLMFAACLTPEKDAQKRPIIQFQYRRRHFSLEDAKTCILQLKNFVDAELKSLIESDQGL